MKRTYLTPRTSTLTIACTHIMEGTSMPVGGDSENFIGEGDGNADTDINWVPDYRENNDELW